MSVPAETAFPLIFDRRLQCLRRDRAAARFATHDFLKVDIAERLMERLDVILRPFARVLDLGSHDGTLARLVRDRPGTDLVIALDRSARLAAKAPAPQLVGDEELLPFGDGSLDLVVSALSLHWVNDLPGALIQIRRALRPDGLFLAALFGAGTLRELRSSLIDAEAEITGGAAPRVGPFLDMREGAALLQRAGFALPVADLVSIEVTYEHPFALLRDIRGMGEASAPHDRQTPPLRRAVLQRMIELYGERHRRDDGRLRASVDIVMLTGWAPHQDQPRPLAPGSARIRLEDALKALKT